MLKLTNRRDRSMIYVAPAHVASLSESGRGSMVYLAGGNFHEVHETPTEILALPEMVDYYAIKMHPMYQVPPVTQMSSPLFPVAHTMGTIEDTQEDDTFRPLGDCVHEMMERIHTKRQDRD